MSFKVTRLGPPRIRRDTITVGGVVFDSDDLGGIPETLLDAKGDLIAASAADTAARLPVISGNGSSLVVASGETTGLKWQLNKYDATVAPTVNEDSGDGYSVGSIWIDVTGDDAYICVDASSGAAVWLPFDAGGGASWEGTWSAGTYTMGQIVEHNDVIYQVNVSSTTDEPPSADWDVLYTAPSGGGSTFWRTRPFMISTLSPEAIGLELQLMANTTPTSANSQLSNSANFIPFVLESALTVTKMWWINGAAVAGNIDVGVYDTTGTRLVSIGPTAQVTTTIIQEVNVADTALAAGWYYLAIASTTSGSTQRVAGITATSAGQLRSFGCYQVDSLTSGTLPSSVTFAAITTTMIPIVGISGRTLVV